MKGISLSILFLFIFAAGFTDTAQNKKTDSLFQLASETHDVARKVELYTVLSKSHLPENPTESRKMGKQALRLSNSISSIAYLGEIYGCFGDIAIVEDSLGLARQHYVKALNYFVADNDSAGMAGVNLVLGNIAYVQDDLATAMQYYMQTIDYSRQSGLEQWLPDLNLNIGSINAKAGQYDEALVYFLKALEAASNTGDSIVLAVTMNNIGMAYSELGELDLAVGYINNALEIYQLTAFRFDASWAYADKANVEYKKGNYQLALDNLEQGLEIIESHGDYSGPKSQIKSIIYNRKGKVYLALGKPELAKTHFVMAYEIGRTNKQTSVLQSATKGIADYWDQKGNSDSTLKYFRIFKSYSDSVNNEDNIWKLAYQAAQFNYEQQLTDEKEEREEEAEKQARNKVIFIFIIVLLVMMLVVAVLLLKLGRNKVKRIELEQRTLKKELELRNKELATHVIYQVKNNEFILNVSKKLKNALSIILPENRPLINEVIKEIEFDSTQDAWKEFEVRFQRVHSGFNQKLATNYPDLSANELRLCSFLRLNMNTKDISAITYQSTNSIDVARSRLRQKLGLEKDDSLVTFLSQF